MEKFNTKTYLIDIVVDLITDTASDQVAIRWSILPRSIMSFTNVMKLVNKHNMNTFYLDGSSVSHDDIQVKYVKSLGKERSND